MTVASVGARERPADHKALGDDQADPQGQACSDRDQDQQDITLTPTWPIERPSRIKALTQSKRRAA
ncbi:hypothetical protein CSW64_13235 [Caulobacter mirabilis]|uniref:Uncharacterized protein n=1 Tax=Caulobacter mirabilis TaxID=69666 RepID=A0A2D2AZ76_9CAUL|nr:hypothetical protein CSW64_13235 [Caulobacter mirabilis]